MKRTISILAITLTIVLGFALTANAFGWGLPKKSFSRCIDNALKKERWGHPDEAVEYWKEAIPKGDELMEALPDKGIYFAGTARCQYALGDYDKAIALYEQALKIWTDKGKKNLNEEWPWVYVYLGMAYAHKGDAAKAVEYWEQVPMTIGSVYTTIKEQIAKYKTTDTAEAQ